MSLNTDPLRVQVGDGAEQLGRVEFDLEKGEMDRGTQRRPAGGQTQVAGAVIAFIRAPPPAARCMCMTTASTIVRYPGSDCTEQFSGIQHPAKVWDVIQDYYIGDVVKEEQVVYTFKVVSKL
jgi:hypothetical protein